MKLRTALVIVGVAGLGLMPATQAAPHHKTKHHVVRKAGVQKTTSQGGVQVNTGDVNGDGTSDLVVTSPPQHKPKKMRQ